jgi:hypothetical protein
MHEMLVVCPLLAFQADNPFGAPSQGDDPFGIPSGRNMRSEDKSYVPYSPGKLRNREGFNSWRADRELSEEGRKRISLAAAFLSNPRNDWLEREHAALELGAWGHASAIRPLVKVLRNEAENKEVRRACIFALSYIADKEVVPPIIRALEDPDLSLNAREQLEKITPNGPNAFQYCREMQDQEEARKCLKKNWQAWWSKHGDEVKLDRAAAFASSPPYRPQPDSSKP